MKISESLKYLTEYCQSEGDNELTRPIVTLINSYRCKDLMHLRSELKLERAIHDLCKRVEEMEAELDKAAAEEAR